MSTDDLAEVYRLGRRIFSSPDAIPAWKPEAIAETLCSDPGFSFVCKERKKISGFLIAAAGSDREKGACIEWICAEMNSAEIKDKLLLAFYEEAVLRDISLITAFIRSDQPGDADYFRGKGFTEIKNHTVMRLVLTGDPYRPDRGA